MIRSVCDRRGALAAFDKSAPAVSMAWAETGSTSPLIPNAPLADFENI